MNPQIEKATYQPPRLEQHDSYAMLTGISIPINVFSSEDPLIEESIRLEGGL